MRFGWAFGGGERTGRCAGEWAVDVFTAGHFESVTWMAAGMESLRIDTHRVLVGLRLLGFVDFGLSLSIMASHHDERRFVDFVRFLGFHDVHCGWSSAWNTGVSGCRGTVAVVLWLLVGI